MCFSKLKGIENLLGVHNLVILDITYNNGSTFPGDETFGLIKSSTRSKPSRQTENRKCLQMSFLFLMGQSS